MTDDEAKINRGNRIGDPIASVDFCSVPSCYPSVHFVSLWGAILATQGFSDLSLLCHKGTAMPPCWWTWDIPSLPWPSAWGTRWREPWRLTPICTPTKSRGWRMILTAGQGGSPRQPPAVSTPSTMCQNGSNRPKKGLFKVNGTFPVRPRKRVPRSNAIYSVCTVVFLRLNRNIYGYSRKSIYSNSIVAGGLLVISYNTRLTPATSLTMRILTRSSNS